MKIVFFTDAYWPRVNGVTVSVDSFSHALIRAGHEVMIICPFYPESPAIERISTTPPQAVGACCSRKVFDSGYIPLVPPQGAGVCTLRNESNREDKKEGETKKPTIIRIPSMPMVFSKEDRVAKYHKLLWVSKHIDDFDPDIVHINTEFVIADFGFQYAWLHNLPAIYTYHTLWENYLTNYVPMLPSFIIQAIVWFAVRSVLKRANMVIVPTQQIQELVKKYKVRKETRLLPTGIDPSLFNHDREEIENFREMLSRKYPALKNKRILLYVGRITREKNFDFLLSIAPEILEKHPETVFLFVGNGPDVYSFQEQCEKLMIASSCVFTGYLDREDVALTYSIADIFVFPSLTETQGLVTIEAMFSGIPVVAIGVMGTLMVMNGDNGGFMVKPDRNEFIGRVFDLLEDRELYRKKALEARNYAKMWTIDTLTVKLENMYLEARRRFKKP